MVGNLTATAEGPEPLHVADWAITNVGTTYNASLEYTVYVRMTVLGPAAE